MESCNLGGAGFPIQRRSFHWQERLLANGKCTRFPQFRGDSTKWDPRIREDDVVVAAVMVWMEQTLAHTPPPKP